MRIVVPLVWIGCAVASLTALIVFYIRGGFKVSNLPSPPVSVEPVNLKPEPLESDVFHVGRWVRHRDGDLGLVEEVGRDLTYRIRVETDAKDKKASWYLGTFWTTALPKAREWWRNTRSGVLFQPAEDWTTCDGEEFPYEPVNWGRG